MNITSDSTVVPVTKCKPYLPQLLSHSITISWLVLVMSTHGWMARLSCPDWHNNDVRNCGALYGVVTCVVLQAADS